MKQPVPGEEHEDLYYNADNLKQVRYTEKVLETNSIANDAIDAYSYFNDNFDLTTASASLDAELTRPFGKIRLLASDQLSGVSQSERPVKAMVKFASETKIPNSFDVTTGAASGEMILIDFTFDAKNENALVSGNDVPAYLLGNAYIFASPSKTNYSMDVTVYSDEGMGAQIGHRQVSNIPLQENKLTTVIGNFYTNEGSLDVIVDDLFEEPENEVPVVEEVRLQTLEAAESKLVELSSDPDKADIDKFSVIVTERPDESDNNREIDIPAALEADIDLTFEQGVPAGGLTVKSTAASEGNSYAKKVVLTNNSTEKQPITIDLPDATFRLASGSYSAATVTTSENTFVLGVDAVVETLTVNKGNVKLYGIIENAFENSGKVTVYRCLSNDKSLQNLLNDNISGYTEILIEEEADIDGSRLSETKPELVKPVTIMSDAKVSNLVFKPEQELTYVVTISGEDVAVTLDGCDVYHLFDGGAKSSSSAICVNGVRQNVVLSNSNVVMTKSPKNQRGVNISEATDATVTLDNTHIGVSIEPQPDVYDNTMIEEFKASSDSRAISFFNNKGLTTLNITNGSLLERTFYALNWAGTSGKVIVNVEASQIDGRAAFNINTGVNEINVRNSKLVGRNYFTGPTENFAVIIYGYDCEGTKVKVSDNSEIISHNSPQTATNFEFSASLRSPSCELTVENSTLKELANGEVMPRMNYFIEDDWYGDNIVNVSNVAVEGKEGALALPLMVWDGKRKTEPRVGAYYNEDKIAEDFYVILEPSDLAWIADRVNEGSELKDMRLFFVRDMDFGGHSWIPVGCNGGEKSFKSSVVGNGMTVRNLVVNNLEASQSAGLFGTVKGGVIKDLVIENAVVKHVVDGSNGGVAVVAGSLYPNGTVQNVTVRNATIESNRWTGAIAGYIYGSVNGCTVENTNITLVPDMLLGKYDNGDKCGGIVGYSAADNHGTITGNSVLGLTVKGYRDLGGIAGAAKASALTDNTVENITVIVDQKTGNYGQKDANAGYVLGRNLGTESLPESNLEKGNNKIEML